MTNPDTAETQEPNMTETAKAELKSGFVQPTPQQIADAASIVDCSTVISAYAACEWDCLDENGKVWIAAIVREAQARERASGRVSIATLAARV